MNNNKQRAFKKLLETFPKSRPTLPVEYLKIYENEYLENRTAGGFGNKIARNLESWMHLKVTGDSRIEGEEVLEIGAGSLNHLKYERKYSSYDVVEPFEPLIKTSKDLSKIRRHYLHINEVPRDRAYDRIFSIAVLEHLLDLPMEIAQAGLLLHPNGVFSAGIPSEGAWLWKMAWKYGTGPGFKKRTGLEYDRIMRYEHVNTADEIESCIRFFFGITKISRFPTPLKAVSLYSFISASEPNKEKCAEYIALRRKTKPNNNSTTL